MAAAVHETDQSVRHTRGLCFVYMEGAAVVLLEIAFFGNVDVIMCLVISLVAAGGAGLLIDLVVVGSSCLGTLAQQRGIAEGVHHRACGLIVPCQAGIVAEALMPMAVAGGGGDHDGLTLAVDIGQTHRFIGGVFRHSRFCIDSVFIAVCVRGFDGDFLRGHGYLAVRNHAVILKILTHTAGFRRHLNGECGGMRAAELVTVYSVFQHCRRFVIINSVPLIGIASRTAFDGDGEGHRMIAEPEQTVGRVFIIIYGNAGGAANGSGLPINIQLVAHTVTAHGAHAVAVVAMGSQTYTVGLP